MDWRVCCGCGPRLRTPTINAQWFQVGHSSNTGMSRPPPAWRDSILIESKLLLPVCPEGCPCRDRPVCCFEEATV
eukprot:4384528-Karenia_brevis.AAC.2